MKKRFTFILTLTALLCFGAGNIWGDELTIYDGTTTSQYHPFYGSYCDQYVRSQMIYPASSLTSLNGKQFDGLKFYLKTAVSTWGVNFEVYLSEVSASNFNESSAWNTESVSKVLVYSGSLTGTGAEVSVPFATPYIYGGGNLMVEFKTTSKGSYPSTYFYGQSTGTNNTSVYGKSASSTTFNANGRSKFLAKMTITYSTPSVDPDPSDCPVPTELDVPAAYIMAHGAKVTWTMGEAVSSTLEYKLNSADADAWEEVSTGNTAGEYTFTSGLLENTKYDVRVKNICSEDESAYTATVSFTTDCDAKSVPYSIGFETSEGCTSGAYAPCWAKIGTPAVIANSEYTTYAKTGTQALRFNGSAEQYLILPQFAQEVKNLSITFWYKHYFYTYYSSNIVLGSMTDPADKTTFTPLEALTQTNDYLQVEDYDLSEAPSGDYYIAFKYTASSSSAAVMLDDISVKQASACKKPASLTATAASATSIDLSWTAKGKETAWQVQYRVGAGSWSSPVNASTNPFTLSGLTAQTTYEIQVRANCGGEQSDWSASAEATTLCDAQAIPWSENFEGMSNGSSTSPAPDCWAYLGLNSGSYPYAYPYNKTSYGDPNYFKGTRALFLESSTSKDSYIILPAFATPLNTLQLTFSHMEENAARSGSLVVGYMTNIADASSFVAVDGGTCVNAAKTWTDEEISLASVPAGVASTARLAIKYVRGTYGNDYYTAIDDITVSELPACPKPVLTATNVIYNGATINWADGSSEKKWKLQYKAAGDADWTDANGGALIAASSFALDGLTPGTAYQVHAQAECEGDWSNAVSFTPNYVTPTNFQLDAKSANSATISWTANSGESSWTVQYKKSSDADWTTVSDVTVKPYTITGLTSATTYQVKVAAGTLYTSPISVTTDCEAKAPLGYSEGFEDFATGNTASTGLLCWDELNASHTNYSYPQMYVSTNATYVQTGSKCLYFVSSDSKYIYAILPEFTGSFAGLQLVFSHKEEDETRSGHFTLGYMTDIADAATFTAITTTPYTRAQAWNTETEDLSSVPAGKRLAFRYGGASNNYYAGIDDIRIEEKPACANPSKPAISNVTASSAVVTWTSEASEFALQYKKGAGEWQNATGTIESPFTLSGLDEQSTYTVQVKAICGVGNESEFVASDAFTTNCAEKELGYEMSFGATLDACWDNSNYGYSTQWVIAESSYMKYRTSNNINCNGELNTPTISLPSDKEAILRFDWQNTGVTASLKISVDGATPVDISAAVNTDLSTITSDWTEKTISLSDYKGHSVAFVFRGQYKDAKNKDLFLDNFKVIEKPCDTPTSLDAVATSNGATVTWTAGGDESQWNLRYREIAEPENSWTLVENVTSGYAITGLMAAHNYEVQVQAYCDATHQSAWSASVNFTPVCGAAPTNLAVSARTTNSATLTWESAESTFLLQTSPDGDNWESPINVNDKTYNLTGLNAGTTYYARVQNACGGEYASASFTTWCGLKDAAELPLEINNFTAVPDCWQIAFVGEYSAIANGKIFFYGDAEQMAVLPAYDIELNKLSVTFSFTPSATNLEFGYIDEPNGAFHAFASQPASDVELNLENEAAAAKYIAIRYHDGGANTSASITGVQLRKTPTCLKPTDVTIVEGVDQATVSWTSTATAWNLQYKPASAAAWQVATGTITNPFTLSGLEQGTNYKVRVQAACAGDELSDWSDEASFTTSCSGIASIPWDADFSTNLSNCWTIHCESPEYYSPTVYDGLQIPGGNAGHSNVVVLPGFSTDIKGATITLRYQCDAAAGNAAPQIGYVTDKSDASSFAVLTDGTDEIGNLEKSSSFKTVYLPLSALPVGASNLAIRYAGGTSEGNLTINEFRVSHVEIFEDVEDANNVSRLETLKSAGPIDVVLERPILRNGDYNTICLPFDLSAAQLTDTKCPLNGFEVRNYDHSDVDVNNNLVDIYLRTVGSIEAGKACFIRLVDGTLDRLTMADFRDVTIKTSAITATDDNTSGIHYIGVFDPHELTGNDSRNLYLSTNSTLYIPASNSTMKGFRAYFGVDEEGPAHAPIRHGARVRITEPHDAPTDFENVQNNVQSIKVLENDRVVIIRNGVKYTIQGQKIQ